MDIDRWDKHPWNKNPFNQQRQSVWRERALTPKTKGPKTKGPKTKGDGPSYPTWMRIGMLALGCHRKDGEAHFMPGELAQLLGVSEATLKNELKKARDYGWLTPDSSKTCLVVPPHAVHGGM